MKNILKKTGIVIGGVVFLLSVVAGGYILLRPKPPPPPEAVSSVAKAEAYAEKLVEFGTPPGLSLVVVKEGAIVYNKAFGLADGPNKIPATPETVYKWWSTTKIPTAIAILQLHERGQLDIDDPAAEYLPFFDITYPSDNSEIITIRHLLNHSSGMPDNVPEVVAWMHLADEPPLNQTTLLERVFPDYAKLKFEPGDHAEYSNVGYMVLGAIIEAVSGQSYETYVVNQILQPLSMNNTNFVYTGEMLKHAAVGSHPVISLESVLLPFLYDDLGAYIRERTDGKIWFNRFYADSDPPTGLIGPATDLARLLMAFQNQGKVDGARILAPATVAMMTYDSHVRSVNTGQTDAPVQGLGWHVYQPEGRMYIAHGGGGPGFGSEMRLYPDESLGLIVFANDTTYDHAAILDLFARLDW
ncbi:MAG: serine hydrolase domain-containing protein [Caldilineaceae bacterium]